MFQQPVQVHLAQPLQPLLGLPALFRHPFYLVRQVELAQHPILPAFRQGDGLDDAVHLAVGDLAGQ
ncbi:MAG: hypothetical protein FJ316_10660 [SAR202 cluster bacterium]|nr:hypothetical protein [SAR202 cluster bacterium]